MIGSWMLLALSLTASPITTVWSSDSLVEKAAIAVLSLVTTVLGRELPTMPALKIMVGRRLRGARSSTVRTRSGSLIAEVGNSRERDDLSFLVVTQDYAMYLRSALACAAAHHHVDQIGDIAHLVVAMPPTTFSWCWRCSAELFQSGTPYSVAHQPAAYSNLQHL